MKTNSLRAWVLAARPKTLTGAIAPVLVGGAFAFAQAAPRWSAHIILPFALCLLFAVLMQVDANFINDYFDFRKGTDREDRLGPERACAQGWLTPHAMRWGIAVTTLLSCLVGVGIMLWHAQYELLLVGIVCVLFSFLYTTRLSYLGWGDLLVLIFFGLVPVVFTCYVMTDGGWDLPLIIASIAMGMATDNLLMVNNYRDRHQDLISGKQTLVVRIIEAQKRRHGTLEGQKRGEQICLRLYLWLGILSTILGLVALFLFPLSSIRCPLLFVYLILHLLTFRQMKSLDGRALNQVLGATARNIFLFGLLLAVSIFL